MDPPQKKGERKEWVIEMAGLQEHRKSRTAILSGGWKQRLALGSAILHEPPILFLDEPTSGVGPISRRQFWVFIYALSGKGFTAFVTIHYVDEAEYCDGLGLIYRGETIAIGTPQRLKTEHVQEEALEVISDRPQEAMGEIERAPGVQEVVLFGKGLHVVVEGREAAMAVIRDLLRQRGYRVQRIEKIIPSLEDVFVPLIEAHDRARAPQQEVRA